MVNANIPWIESPFFDEILKTKNLSEKETAIVKEYHDNGYVVIPGMLPAELVDRVREEVEKKAFDPNFPLTSQRDEVRVQDFWLASEASKELAVYPEVLKLLELFYGRKVIPFQTLNFKRGSGQRAHSDTIHFSSLPPRYMCGVWVALEDVTEENGPVFYYPGSQRLPEYNFSHIRNSSEVTSYENYKEYEDYMEAIVEAKGLEKKQFLAKKGDLLIWSSNIIHGGSPILDKSSTRFSQVTHYFFEDCYYYTPMMSNMVTGELDLRLKLVDIRTRQRIEQSYNGTKLNYVKTGRHMYMFTGRTKVPSLFKLFLKLGRKKK